MVLGTRIRRRSLAVALAAVLLLALVPGAAAAETGFGGSYVLEEGERVDGLGVFAGNVIVRGTVDGDLAAFGGNVLVADTGTVTGDVEAVAGNVRVAGTVDGNLEVAGGNLDVAAGATVGGNVEAAVGSLTVAGSVGGDVEAAAETVFLTGTASVGGDVRYDGELADDGASVGGTVSPVDGLAVSVGSGAFALDVPRIPAWAGAVYGLLVNLALGLLLLAVFPRFARGVAARTGSRPVRTGGLGLLALLAAPVLLVLVALTVVGIPLSLLGVLLYGAAVWVGLVFGLYAIGSWGLSLAGVDSRFLALFAGVLASALLGFVPVVGSLFDLAAVLLGVGALAAGLWAAYRARRQDSEDRDPEVAAV